MFIPFVEIKVEVKWNQRIVRGPKLPRSLPTIAQIVFLCSFCALSGGVFAQDGQAGLDKSLARSRTAAFSHSKDPVAHSEFGIALAAAGHFPEAIGQMKDAVWMSHNNPTYVAALAKIFAECGRAREARSGYTLALRLDPGNVQALVGLADIDRIAGKNVSAVSLYQRAEEIDPLNFDVHSRLADAFLDLHRFGGAEIEFQYCLCIRPLDAGSMLFLATAQSEQGKLDEAIATLNGILAVPQVSAKIQSDAYVQLGALMLQAGRSADAVDVLRKAQALAPDDPQVANALGAALYSNGEIEEANEEWKTSLSSSDQDAKQTAKAWMQMK
jgi:Flp pilus assembly protein TadD